MPWIQIVGNAVVDRFMKIGEGELAELGVEKGDGDYSRDPQEITDLIKKHGPGDLVPGGSVANIARILGQLGVSTSYIGRTASDLAGHQFYADMQTCNVQCQPPEAVETGTYEVLCMNTADGERTFLAASSVSLPLTSTEAIGQLQQDTEWTLLEGYLMFEQAEAVFSAQELAKKQGKKIIFTLATPAVIEACWSDLAKVLETGVDLIFANEEEMVKLVQAAQNHDSDQATELVQAICDTDRVVTRSGDGASWLGANGDHVEVTCEYNPDPVDTTGAGDSFAAGFIYGMHQGESVEACLEMGHALGHKVIQQVGARLDGITADVFNKKAA